MKTIAECRANYENYISNKIQELVNEKLVFEHAVAKTDEIFKKLAPVFKKLHLTDFDDISICPQNSRFQENGFVVVNVSFNTDDKFKYFKKSKYDYKWWKNNAERVYKRIDKMIAAINAVELNVRVSFNQFSLVDDGDDKKKCVLATFTFDN